MWPHALSQSLTEGSWGGKSSGNLEAGTKAETTGSSATLLLCFTAHLVFFLVSPRATMMASPTVS